MTIEELLNSMQTKYKKGEGGNIKALANTKDTWKRIAEKDSFDDLGFSSTSEKEEFLKEWIKDNPYNAVL